MLAAEDLDTPATLRGHGRGRLRPRHRRLHGLLDRAPIRSRSPTGISRFLAIESCGQCTPCKQDGLEVADQLDQLRRGETSDDAIERIMPLLAARARGARAATSPASTSGSCRASSAASPDVAVAHATDQVASEPVLIAPIIDIDDDGVVHIDEDHRTKQPDWEHGDSWNGQSPADRLRRVGHHQLTTMGERAAETDPTAPPTTPIAVGRLRGMSGQAAIRLAGLTKQYPGRRPPAVDHLDLEIPAGEIVALVGPSGCGKTTTLKMINRLIEPTEGTIEIDGRPVDELPGPRAPTGHRLRHPAHRPVPPQDHRGQHRHRPQAARLGPRTASRSACTSSPTSSASSARCSSRYPGALSGGQQQRVGVARALAADPPILLMDEPYSAVDPIVRARSQDELLDLQRRVNKTIVLVTHDVDEAHQARRPGGHHGRRRRPRPGGAAGRDPRRRRRRTSWPTSSATSGV